MKTACQTEDKYPPTILRNLIALTLLFLPFSVQLSNLAIIITSFYWLISRKFNSKFEILLTRKTAIILFTGIFFIYLISSIYSSDMARVLRVLERNLPILAMPVIIGSYYWKKKMLFNLLKVFLLSCFLVSLYAIIKTIYYFNIHPEGYFLELALWKMPQLVHFHAPYFALYMVIANICAFTILSSEKVKKSYNWILWIFLAFSNLFLFLLSSRTALFANWVLISIVIVKYYYSKKKYWQILLSFFAVGLILMLAYYNIPFLNTKISYILKEGFGIFFRLRVAEITINLFKESPIIGFGIGDGFEVLQQAYIERGLQKYVGFNTHNQYLYYLLSTGIIGTIFFLSMLFYSFKLALKQKTRTYLAILFVFCICFLTEEILSRQKGIVLFAIFNSLFAFSGPIASQKTIQ